MVGKPEHMSELMDEGPDSYRHIAHAVELLGNRVAVDGYAINLKFRMDSLKVIAMGPDGIGDRRICLTVSCREAIDVIHQAVTIGVEDSEI